MHFHDWWAKIDTALGITHNQTYDRQQIIDLIEPLSNTWTFYEYADLSKDAHDAGTIEEIMAGIDKYLERAKDLPDFISLEQQKAASFVNNFARWEFNGLPFLLLLARRIEWPMLKVNRKNRNETI